MIPGTLDLLIVDTARSGAERFVPVLHRHGHTVRIASDAATAERLYTERPPAATLLEVDRDPAASTRTVRRLRKHDPKAGMIALTAWPSVETIVTMREAGVTEFVATAARREPARASTGADSARTVLLVDDEPTIGALLARFLEARGYAAQSVGSGADALAILSRRHPDVLVADVFMPEIKGWELLQEARARGYRGAAMALSAAQDDTVLRRLMDVQPVHLAAKPVALDRFELIVQLALTLAP